MSHEDDVHVEQTATSSRSQWRKAHISTASQNKSRSFNAKKKKASFSKKNSSHTRQDSPSAQSRVKNDLHSSSQELLIPKEIKAQDLDAQARRQLLSLSKEHADTVARHLVYAGMLLNENPQLAYEHAHAAYKRAPRINIVREALGVAAYMTEDYAQALRELRTYRRMTNDYTHAPLEADCERGLGRSQKAVSFIKEIPLHKLSKAQQVELMIVLSGAYADLEDAQTGLKILQNVKTDKITKELRARLELVKADRYDDLGCNDKANSIREQWLPVYEQTGEVDYFEEDYPVGDFVRDGGVHS
ncbi:MAG: hypothetical protein J6M18_00970 [Actinomycetaceae bacterium]|nr:hypothetical protein [Actinomycetaceae bacterium]